jgi:hypothetical protein
LNSHCVTGSRAFTTTLREIVGIRAASQVKYFNSYTDAERDAVDVMMCDEAHRIRQTSNSRFTPVSKKSKLSQIDEIFRAVVMCWQLIELYGVATSIGSTPVRSLRQVEKQDAENQIDG